MTNLNKITRGWFSEVCPMWPGYANTFKIEEILFSRKSRFQHVEVFQTLQHGKMLVLDGIIQLTEFDEFAYQEMLTHVPLFGHPDPKQVLVIGGGDGGILREAGRHDCVETIDFCEIDEMVIQVSKEFFPGMACGFDDPRVTVFIEDGNTFVQNRKGRYDVIIVDSSDPIGPAEALFEKPFYEHLKAALRPGGLIATQGEALFLHQDCIQKLVGMTKALFPVQAYANIQVPTYPGGHIGICMGSLGPDPKTPGRQISPELQAQLKYYHPGIHKASFVLPYFAQKMIDNAVL